MTAYHPFLRNKSTHGFKATLKRSPTLSFQKKGTTGHHLVLIMLWLFFKPLSHGYFYILFCIFLNCVVFFCDCFFLFNICLWDSPILKLVICALTYFFFPNLARDVAGLINFLKEMFVVVDYCIFILFFITFSIIIYIYYLYLFHYSLSTLLVLCLTHSSVLFLRSIINLKLDISLYYFSCISEVLLFSIFYHLVLTIFWFLFWFLLTHVVLNF